MGFKVARRALISVTRAQRACRAGDFSHARAMITRYSFAPVGSRGGAKIEKVASARERRLSH